MNSSWEQQFELTIEEKNILLEVEPIIFCCFYRLQRCSKLQPAQQESPALIWTIKYGKPYKCIARPHHRFRFQKLWCCIHTYLMDKVNWQTQAPDTLLTDPKLVMNTCIGGDSQIVTQERGAKPDPIWTNIQVLTLSINRSTKAQELHIFHLEQKNKSKRTREMAQIYPLSAWQLQLNFTWKLI